MGPAAQAVIDIDLEGTKATSEISKLTSAIEGFASNTRSAMYTVGALIAVDQIRDAAVEMLGVFSKADSVVSKLNTTLVKTGNTTGFTSDQLANMRDELASTSTTSATALAEVQNIFARTKVMGGDIFVEATQTAMDFAAAMDTDVKNAAEELSEAMMDPANEIEKFRRFGIAFTDQEKAMLTQLQSTGKGMEAQRYVLNRLNDVVGGQAAAAFGTLGGQQTAMANRLDKLQGTIGGMIAEAIEPLYGVVINVIDAFTAWLPVIQVVTEGMIAGATSIIGWITPLTVTQEAIIGWSATVQSVMERWDDYIAVALLNAGANVMAFATDIQYYFTEVIPAYAKGMWTVMKEVFFSLGDIFNTLVTNIKNMLSQVWEAIKSIMAGEMPKFTPTALLEGFELKLSAMPAIAGKKMSETEQVMRQAAADLSMDLGKDIAVKTQVKLDEAKAKEEALAKKDTEQKALTLGPGPSAGSSGSATEGILAMADRISAAASAVKLEQAVGVVAAQQAKTNELLAEGNKIAEKPINVNVKQDDVVTAIKESTAAIVKASSQPAGFT